MQKAIAKADALIEAMGYIRQFRGKIVVVKLGGSVLDDVELQKALLNDVAFMSTVGMRPVIVHGGGKAINKAMEDSGLEPVWIQGRRFTDERTLTLVEHTLVHGVNASLCTYLSEQLCSVMGLHSLNSCVLTAERLMLKNGEGKRLNLGHVGKVVEVNGKVISSLCDAGVIPIIAPVARDKAGGKLNVNADNAAGMVAAACQAEKLVMVSDTHGILQDIKDPSSTISSLDERKIKQMIDEEIITGAMFPKVDACLTAIDHKVKKAHIIDGRIPHSLLLEIYTKAGIGTEIIK